VSIILIDAYSRGRDTHTPHLDFESSVEKAVDCLRLGFDAACLHSGSRWFFVANSFSLFKSLVGATTI
jgi:hypothetical protein